MLSHLRSPNLLLIGPDAETRVYLARLMASFASPVVCCDGAKAQFPDGPVGSLIVRDVDGNRYEIKRFDDLDTSSRLKIEGHL